LLRPRTCGGRPGGGDGFGSQARSDYHRDRPAHTGKRLCRCLLPASSRSQTAEGGIGKLIPIGDQPPHCEHSGPKQ
jgi:hypothetical protein